MKFTNLLSYLIQLLIYHQREPTSPCSLRQWDTIVD